VKIIVVDDNMNIGDLLTEILVQKGYDATFFCKPTAAYANMQTVKYDVALLDVQMPEMDGFDLCRLIKSNELTKQTRVIFVSNYTANEYTAKAARVGAEGYIDKCQQPEAVIREIEKVLSKLPPNQ
jgi:DNA-binding response OmpR family regulator